MERESDGTARLNEIIKRLRDRQAALQNAARRTEDDGVRGALTELAAERERFVSEVQQVVAELGVETEQEGSVSGALRRGLANFASEMLGEDVRPEVRECHIEEHMAAREYERALENKEALPRGLASILERQLQRTRRAVEYLRGLREKSRPVEP